jgi:hypothetical protein
LNDQVSFLKELYQRHSRVLSLIEITIYFGTFVFNIWIVPFWFWGIYRLELDLPEPFKIIFYRLWHETYLVNLISITLSSCLLVMSFLIRRESLKELGIRIDNFHRSGRECAMISVLSIIVVASVSVFYFDRFNMDHLVDYFIKIFKEPLWSNLNWISQRIGQQFLLQSVFLIRFLHIFQRKSIALVGAAVLFSFAHSPNIKLMILSFLFGSICCLLFLRNRNIFTIGLMHAVLIMVLSPFLILGLIDHLKIGPQRGSPEFIADIAYRGDKIIAHPSEKKEIPIFVINKSIATWNSNDQGNPHFISYHLLNAKKGTVQYDNVRTPFREKIQTNESTTVDLLVHVPGEKGDYYLEVDIVKEKVRWFKERGSKTVLIPISVN